MMEKGLTGSWPWLLFVWPQCQQVQFVAEIFDHTGFVFLICFISSVTYSLATDGSPKAVLTVTNE